MRLQSLNTAKKVLGTVRYIYLNDKAGNTISYTTQDLMDLGYDVNICVGCCNINNNEI